MSMTKKKQKNKQQDKLRKNQEVKKVIQPIK